jgi:hypothetical protein
MQDLRKINDSFHGVRMLQWHWPFLIQRGLKWFPRLYIQAQEMFCREKNS